MKHHFSRFTSSVDWKAVVFVTAAQYALAIFWALCYDESIPYMLLATTVVLIIFVGVPLLKIYLETRPKS